MRAYHVFLGASLVVAALPGTASACGGLFCSVSQVDQSGERIVYALEGDGSVTMTVQIQYRGNDEDFAWVIPVPVPPRSIGIGSERLFDALANATEPSFEVVDRTEGACRAHPACVSGDGCPVESSSGGCGYSSPAAPEWTGGYIDAARPREADSSSGGREDASFGPGVTVFGESSFGPYESVVLGAATAAEVVEWLTDGGYQVPEESTELLEPYAAARHVFVALRLRPKRTSNLLRPVVLEIPFDEPCLPIRLTPVATVPNLPITAFFLGAATVRPTNYEHVEVDTGNLALFLRRTRWETVVGLAVDSAGGQAFTTDYAGRTPAVAVELPSVADLATEADAAALLRSLAERGYIGTPLLQEVLEVHVEPPADGDARTYYNCLTRDTTSYCGRPAHYDPVALVAQLERELVEPSRRAQEMIGRHGRLTRLFTVMKAEHMTLDPIFAEVPSAPDQASHHRATRVTSCSSAYYDESAPRMWRVAGRTEPISAGYPANDEEYCRALGGHLAGTVSEMCARPSSSSGGGGVCAVVGVGPPGGALAMALVMIIVRRSRRR